VLTVVDLFLIASELILCVKLQENYTKIWQKPQINLPFSDRTRELTRNLLNHELKLKLAENSQKVEVWSQEVLGLRQKAG
jgi:hypothetical protein